MWVKGWKKSFTDRKGAVWKLRFISQGPEKVYEVWERELVEVVVVGEGGAATNINSDVGDKTPETSASTEQTEEKGVKRKAQSSEEWLRLG